MLVAMGLAIFAPFSMITRIPNSAVAGGLSYTCEILRVYKLQDDGSLGKSIFEDQFRGGKFSVSRLDGQIIGEVLPTISSSKTSVISKGDDQWSFRAAAYFDRDIQMIEVREFNLGAMKPFQAWSTSGAGIVTGVCE
ncbi:MAG: hypothetical protein O3A84_11535 [Proteobacteria bacterium]|nr:hypothetical protein [Pseudomonadota bacterium]